MSELTSEWFRKIDGELRRREVPPKQRPWLAWEEWAKHTGEPISFGDETTKEIFRWFERNSRAGSQYVGPMYVGAFNYNSSFWPVAVPLVLGRVQLDARDSLKTMPDAMVLGMFRNRAELLEYGSLWGNCLDYAFGMDNLKAQTLDEFTKQLLAGADQKLKATVTLLLEDRPNPSSLESARMATEMFLKAFLAAKAGLREEDAKHRISHNLEEALKLCAATDAKSELLTIQSSFNIFPDIGDRYKGRQYTWLRSREGV